MSKSLNRVRTALINANLPDTIRETVDARTAQEAADALGCELDQIAKSVIFRGSDSDDALLFLTAGANQVDMNNAAHIAGENLGKADANFIRAQTGFAIGGVSPIGHISPIRAFFDPRLFDFPVIWAAAGTPRHVFSATPQVMKNISIAQLFDFTR